MIEDIRETLKNLSPLTEEQAKRIKDLISIKYPKYTLIADSYIAKYNSFPSNLRQTIVNLIKPWLDKEKKDA